LAGLDSIRNVRVGGSWAACPEQLASDIAVAKTRSEEKDLTQRTRRAEHRGHRELVRWGIRNFTKNGRAACASCGRHVAWALMKRFVSQ